MRGQQRREEGVLGEITNKETTFSFCCCTACLASSQVSPERVGSPLLLSSLLSLPNPHSYALSPNSQKATGEKKEERLEGGELLEQQQQELQESPKDAKRFGFADGSLRFNARELIFFFFFKEKTGGRTRFFSPAYETSNSATVNKADVSELELNASAVDGLMSPGVCGGQ